MRLKRRAQEILSLADKTKRDFLRKDETLSGTVSIGSGSASNPDNAVSEWLKDTGLAEQ